MPFITTDDARWSELLRTAPYDFYHLPEYAQLDAKVLGGKAMGWFSAPEYTPCLIPLISRNIYSHGVDLVSPYGYPGILSREPLSSAEAIRIIQSFHQDASDAGYISTFIRLNTLLNNWDLPDDKVIKLKNRGNTVSIDLLQGSERIIASFSENHRHDIRKLIRNGYTAQVNRWEYFPDFLTAYNQTMNRRKANDYYFFNEDYFAGLSHLPGTKLLFISITDRMGMFVAGGIFMLTGKVIQFHLGATLDIAVSQSPSKLMIMETVNQGLLLKAETLHLGGGTGTSTMDGLFRFKKGFFHIVHPFNTLQIIHNRPFYDGLSNGIPVAANEEYFPAYRTRGVV